MQYIVIYRIVTPVSWFVSHHQILPPPFLFLWWIRCIVCKFYTLTIQGLFCIQGRVYVQLADYCWGFFSRFWRNQEKIEAAEVDGSRHYAAVTDGAQTTDEFCVCCTMIRSSRRNEPSQQNSHIASQFFFPLEVILESVSVSSCSTSLILTSMHYVANLEFGHFVLSNFPNIILS